MAWWLWVLFGIGLLVVEMLTPGGFYALFFGVSAILVAGLAASGATAAWMEWLVFAALGVGLLLLLRPRLAKLMKRKVLVDTLVGEIAFPLAELPPGGTGQAELRGSPWTARNSSGVTLAAGQRCRVERVSDLTIFLHPE